METGVYEFEFGPVLTLTFSAVRSREAACDVYVASSAVLFLSLYSL